jgi:YesN/AraC family two-component response regulator
MTAYSDQSYINEAEELNAEKFLMKPFDLDELRKHIEEVFAAAK